jgi:glutamate racemase
VLSKLKQFSEEAKIERQFIYLGDSARCPYGNRNPQEIARFVKEIITWLIGQGVDGIVIACNTSASVALEQARSLSSVPVFDLITPTALHLAKLGGKVGVMATAATAKSGAFSRAVRKVSPEMEVLELACSELVPIIEKGEIALSTTAEILRNYADLLVKERVDVLVWGCTHFPFLTQTMANFLPKEIAMLDPADVLCGLLDGDAVAALGSQGRKPMQSNCSIYVSGDQQRFAHNAKSYLGYLPGTINGVSVAELVSLVEPSNTESKNTSEGTLGVCALF